MSSLARDVKEEVAMHIVIASPAYTDIVATCYEQSTEPTTLVLFKHSD
jgi:hypothetical protein